MFDIDILQYLSISMVKHTHLRLNKVVLYLDQVLLRDLSTSTRKDSIVLCTACVNNPLYVLKTTWSSRPALIRPESY